jgi:ribonuclease H2 subunit C
MSNDEEEEAAEVGIIEERATFDEIIIWGHEAMPDNLTDPYVKGLEEWISFSEKVHPVYFNFL